MEREDSLPSSQMSTTGPYPEPAEFNSHPHAHFLQVKGKVVCAFLNWAPRHEGVLGSGRIAPRFLDLGTR